MILLIISIFAGLLTAYVIQRTTSPAALRTVRNNIYAHLLEFRLFFDDPGLIWQAQLSLLRDNVRLLRLLLPPTLILAIPMTWLVMQLEAEYGLRPIRPGEAAVVTAQLSRPIDASDRFDLRGVAGITVESPPIRSLEDRQVSWRIRPARDIQGSLRLVVNGHGVGKSVASGGSNKILSPRRSRSLAAFLLHPEEPRLPDGGLAWVEVAYPEAGAGWIVWFLAISAVAALSSRRFPPPFAKIGSQG